MTSVIRIAGRIAGTSVQTPAQIITTISAAAAITPDHQAAVENALSMALYFIRQSHATPANLWAATARTNRALTLLKQASEEARAAMGRA
jgi:hypothetical protein